MGPNPDPWGMGEALNSNDFWSGNDLSEAAKFLFIIAIVGGQPPYGKGDIGCTISWTLLIIYLFLPSQVFTLLFPTG